MFIKHEGGRSVKIGVNDTTYEVHLPPEGFGYNHELRSLEPVDTIVRSQIPDECYWERKFDLEDYNHKRALEKRAQTKDPDYNDPELQFIRSQEWHRRLYGVWFANYNPETQSLDKIYIPGLYYFFMVHWPLDEGYADFRIPDLEKFYFTQFCIEDPNCFGEIDLTKRRQGKTARAGCVLYERISRTRKVRGGIQSKTLEDAKDIFRLHIIDAFRRLPDFFIPTYDQAQGIAPKSELRFYKTNQKGKGSGDYIFSNDDELESFVDFRNAQKGAYDGSKQFFMIFDEAAKDQETNVWDRHLTTRKCLLDKNGNLVGKMVVTTTVEDMGSFADNFNTLWSKSDYNKKENGKTGSFLYRWFTPAYRTKYIDKYGYPNEERAKLDFEAEWKSLEGDQKAYMKAKRQDPFIWEDAFRSDSEVCIFNGLKLNERLDILRWKAKTYDIGDLDWNDIHTKDFVVFKPNRNGRYRIAQHPDNPNNIKQGGSYKIPQSIGKYTIGVDPYDHVRTKDNVFSQLAAAVFKKHDANDPVFSENFVAFYIGRPAHPHMAYEDVYKLCHYYGCQANIESNKPGCIIYMESNKMGAFLVKDEKGEAGIAGSTKSHIEIAENTDVFIEDRCHDVMFPELITDWLKFDISDTTKFDLAMAAGYALIAANRMKRKLESLLQISKRSSKDYFREYSISGKRSKLKTA